MKKRMRKAGIFLLIPLLLINLTSFAFGEPASPTYTEESITVTSDVTNSSPLNLTVNFSNGSPKSVSWSMDFAVYQVDVTSSNPTVGTKTFLYDPAVYSGTGDTDKDTPPSKNADIQSITIYYRVPVVVPPVPEAVDPVVDSEVSATDVTSGDTLDESTLSGTFKDSESGDPVDGTLTWTDPSTVVNETGDFEWTFTPTNSDSYNVITGMVEVAVTPASAIPLPLDQLNLLSTSLNRNVASITVPEGYYVGIHLSSYDYPYGTEVNFSDGTPYDVQKLFDSEYRVLYAGTHEMIVDLPNCGPVQIDLYTGLWEDSDWLESTMYTAPHDNRNPEWATSQRSLLKHTVINVEGECGEIRLIKMKEDESPHANVTFKLYKEEMLLATRVTDDEGMIIFSGLETNADYFLEEVAPLGYYPDFDFSEAILVSSTEPVYVYVMNLKYKALKPVLECVEELGDGLYRAHWGYLNENDFEVNAIESKFTGNHLNEASPMISNFQPGRHRYVFSTVFNGSNLVWSLKGPDNKNRTATASDNPAQRCTATLTLEKLVYNTLGNLINDDTTPFTIKVEGPDGFEEEYTLQANDLVNIDKLALGAYTVTEINVPNGYTRSTEPTEVTFTVSNKGQKVTIVNVKGTPSISDPPVIIITPPPQLFVPEEDDEIEEIEEIEDEEIALTGDIILEDDDEDEVILDEGIAMAETTLPQTGEASPFMFYGLGTLITALGIGIKKRK